MGLKVSSDNQNFYDFQETGGVLNHALENQPAAYDQEKRNLPPVGDTVTFAALGCDTEIKLAWAAYMAAAAKAGVAEDNARRAFAAWMLRGKPPHLVLTTGKIELDDAKVKSRLFNQSVEFKLSPNEKKALENFRAQYVAKGGRVRFNSAPSIDLRSQPSFDNPDFNPVLTPSTITFRVLLGNKGNPTELTDVVAQFAEDQYRGGNLRRQNYVQIAELSAGQNVRLQILDLLPAGNKVAVKFTLTPPDRDKIYENYKIVQAEVNRALDACAEFGADSEQACFLRGVLNGALGSVKGTVGLLKVPETMTAVWQLVSDPRQTLGALYGELGAREEFRNTPPDKKSEMIGEIVGAATVEILLGKGIGWAGSVLAGTKTGLKMLETADNSPDKITDRRFGGRELEELEPGELPGQTRPEIAAGDESTLAVNRNALLSCGPDACAMILETFGKKVDRSALTGPAKMGDRATTADKLVTVLKTNGINHARWKTRLTLDDLAEATKNGSPAIAAVKLNRGGGRALVVDGVTIWRGKKVVAVGDAAAGGRRFFVPADEFENKFTGQAVLTNPVK